MGHERKQFLIIGTGLASHHFAEILLSSVEHKILNDLIIVHLEEAQAHRQSEEDIFLKKLSEVAEQRARILEESTIQTFLPAQPAAPLFNKDALFKKVYFPPTPIRSLLKAPFFHKSRARSHL